MCSTWQESVPTTGLMHSDQRHPGWNVNRPTSPAPILTTSTVVRSGVRTSSGVEKSLTSSPDMGCSSGLMGLGWWLVEWGAGWRDVACGSGPDLEHPVERG